MIQYLRSIHYNKALSRLCHNTFLRSMCVRFINVCSVTNMSELYYKRACCAKKKYQWCCRNRFVFSLWLCMLQRETTKAPGQMWLIQRTLLWFVFSYPFRVQLTKSCFCLFGRFNVKRAIFQKAASSHLSNNLPYVHNRKFPLLYWTI